MGQRHLWRRRSIWIKIKNRRSAQCKNNQNFRKGKISPCIVWTCFSISDLIFISLNWFKSMEPMARTHDRATALHLLYHMWYQAILGLVTCEFDLYPNFNFRSSNMWTFSLFYKTQYIQSLKYYQRSRSTMEFNLSIFQYYLFLERLLLDEFCGNKTWRYCIPCTPQDFALRTRNPSCGYLVAGQSEALWSSGPIWLAIIWRDPYSKFRDNSELMSQGQMRRIYTSELWLSDRMHKWRP